MNIVGSLDWQDCDTCCHRRENEGGCEPLDECGDSILEIDFDFDFVICNRHELEKP